MAVEVRSADTKMLAIYQSDIQPFSLMQSRWASELNPVLRNPITNPTILKQVSLVTGANIINTGLQQTLQGWFISDLNAAVTIYRSASKAPLTLTLTSSGNAVVDIVVF